MIAAAPDAGDIVWISLDPQAGHEQAGRRPAVVLTPKRYNQASGLCIAVPVTGKIKGFPFETPLPEGLPVSGVVLTDHLKSLDWEARRAEVVGRVPEYVLDDIRAKLKPLLF